MAEAAAPVFTYSFAKERGLILLDTGETVTLGMREGAPATALLEARRVLRQPIRTQPLSKAEFDRHLSEAYAAEGIASTELADEFESRDDLSSLLEDIPQTADLLDTDDDAPIIRLINGLIAEAVRQRASDIHVEPFEERLVVRLRIDGVMHEILRLSQRLAPVLVSRIKVMARLDIAEKRIPQDGRISLSLGGHSLDVRVSTLPSKGGERVVMRLLDKSQNQFRIEDLGMGEELQARFKKALSQPNGIILVTGPTGSGKTTTLYGGLALLNDHSRNILTVEDPVEYAIEGVGQTQVNAKVGMTFAAGLRAILRQDPDVVMVGEIRDPETAEIAVQASLTGHLVLSTVHTNDAISAIARLRDMGVEPFLLASTVKAILAQRLVRRLCPHCRTPFEAGEAERTLMNLAPGEALTLYAPNGCEICQHTGYQGRMGIFEMVSVGEELRRRIHDDAREHELSEIAFKDSETLLQSGLRHVRAGDTSLEEVLRVCRHDGA